jgi:hypothetical protein
VFKRIPTWAWFLIFLVFCFAIANPTGYSLIGLFEEVGASNPFVWILAFILFLVPGLAAWQGVRELSWFGRIAFLVLVGLILWAATMVVSVDAIMDTAFYWIHVVIAAFLTLSLRFAKWRRDITTTVSADDPDEEAA